jgi:AsmA protein
MSRAMKTGLLLLAVPLFVVSSLILGLSAAAPMLAERIGLARSIEAAVFAATGQRLLIAAEPRLRLLPHPLIELGPLTLSGQHEGDAPLAQAARLRIRFAGLPLLAGRAELAEITLDGVQLSAPADPADAQPAGEEPEGEDAPPAETGQPLIRDARLQLRYPHGGTTWSLIPFESVPIRTGSAGQLDAVIELEGAEPTLQGTLRLSAAVEPSADLSRLHLRNLQLRGSDLAVGEGRGLALAIDANVDYGFDDHDWRFDDIVLTSGSLRVDGDLGLSPSTLPPVASGAFSIAGFDARAWMQQHGYGPGRGTPSTLRCAAARGRFVLTGDDLLLEPALLRIDGTHAAGALAARLGLGSGMALALALDGIELDPYLAPTPYQAPGQALPPVPARVPTTAQGIDCTLPTNSPIVAADLPLLSTDAELSARIDAGMVRVDGLRYGQLAVEIQGDDALIGVDVESADFYGGQLVARMDRDARIANAPRQTLRGRAADIDVAALLTDLQGVAPISGIGNISAELAGSGLDAAVVKADLSGTVAVDVRDGRLLGLDLAPLITAAGGDAADAAAATEFSSLRATATGSGGQFVSQDIDVRSPMLRVSGQGQFDVPAETLDLDLETVFVDPPDGRGPRGLGGIRVPLRVVGDWRQPAWQPDLGPALREGTRRLLDRNRDALKQLEERTGLKGLEQGLRGLLGF